MAFSARQLKDPNSAGYIVAVAFLAGILPAAQILLRPKLAKQGNKNGKYSFDGLVTRNSPEIPLPDILGSVMVAGNSPYTQLSDKNLAVTTPAHQAANKIVVFSGGPVAGIDVANCNLIINGVTFNDASFFNGSFVNGLFVMDDLTDTGAVTGTLGGDTFVPSLTIFNGTYDVSVPVAIAANYDRSFPVYGYAGRCYAVFRLFNAAKFSTFNVNAKLNGRLCRTYDSSGFTVGTSSAEAVGTGDGTTVRFNLDFIDVIGISSLTVGGTAYTQIAPGNQTGNVYNLNPTKGHVEFITAPAASAAIVATYTYYPRSFSNCPADHLVYLLTEKTRGKGFDASRIDWARAVAFQTYCNASVTWTDANGTTTAPRFTTNYAVDDRKAIQDHIQAILDASHAYLFLSGGKFVMKARAQDTSVFSFNEGNILRDSFSSTLVDRSTRPNLIQLFYHDQSAYNSETEVDIGDAADQASRTARVGNDGVAPQTLKYAAVDNAPQAERTGQTLIRESINSLWTCDFKTTILGLALEPGDVVDITHGASRFGAPSCSGSKISPLATTTGLNCSSRSISMERIVD